jgi:hypothetical protein
MGKFTMTKKPLHPIHISILRWLDALEGQGEKPSEISDQEIPIALLELERDGLVVRKCLSELRVVNVSFSGPVYQITAAGGEALAVANAASKR